MSTNLVENQISTITFITSQVMYSFHSSRYSAFSLLKTEIYSSSPNWHSFNQYPSPS